MPANDVFVMESRDEAERYPRGDIELAVCKRCGFVQNNRFDPQRVQYSPRCEESQACSETFSSFAGELAENIVGRFELEGKSVLEIGCGKGDFLKSVCRGRSIAGIGVDPAYRGNSALDRSGERPRFVRDVIENHPDLVRGADAVVCRHMLEHIAQPLKFMRSLRHSMRDGIPVMFDVPALESVLRRRAFWDIYYEHCGYFDKRSLATLFAAAGFGVDEVHEGFDGQYLLIYARAQHGRAKALEPSAAEAIVPMCERFETEVRVAIDTWDSMLKEAQACGRRVALWGGGSKAVALLSALENRDAVDVVIDINPRKQDKYLPGTGHRIVAPATLKDHPVDVIVILNPVYQTEVRAALEAMGVACEMRCLA